MPEFVIVAGTATEVGKTWCAAKLVASLRERGRKVVARKPVQSFGPGTGPTDAEVLGQASGEEAHKVCPPHRSYEAALAPPLAAEILKRPEPRLDDLVHELRATADLVLVECVGGVRSPLAVDGDTTSLARAVGARLAVLVARPDLGTINEVRLACEALSPLKVLVFLNRFDARNRQHRLNLDWLRIRDGFEVHTGVDSIADRLAAT
jgi:dethiobiotin synthetase